VQTSGQVGAALVLAITTAIVSGGRPAHSPAGMLAAYRPGLVFTTFVAIAGLAMALVPLVVRRAGARTAVRADEAEAEAG
jgi:hypothetical protein